MAEILFGLSAADAQLELQEKHYEKLKVKSNQNEATFTSKCLT